MSELFNEIQDDIRQERLDKLWQHVGKVMLAVSAVVVVATIGIVSVQSYRQSQAMGKTAVLMQGIDKLKDDDYKGAIAIFNTITADENSPYYGIAMLRKAQAEIALDQPDEVKKTYEALAKHNDVFGALGKMLNYGHAASGEVIAQPDKNSPLYYTQSEFRGWQLMQQDKKAEALDQFAALANDAHSPASLRERMSEVLQHFAPEKLPGKLLESLPTKSEPLKPLEATHDE